jgi:hypothetical protein
MKIVAAFIMIILVAGTIDNALAFLTFENREARRVDCGMYMLASPVTSLLAICILTIKFWFLVLIQTNGYVDLSVLHAGCIIIETTLHFFPYLSG